MRRIFPLLLILLLLCGCGGNRDAAAPEDADRLVIFTARSAAVYDDAVREFERRTGIWVEVHTADDALPLLEQIAAGQRCDLLLGVTPDCLSACGELFAPYAPEAAADIPGAYRDSEDRWTPFSLLPVVLIYNTKLLSPLTSLSHNLKKLMLRLKFRNYLWCFPNWHLKHKTILVRIQLKIL